MVKQWQILKYREILSITLAEKIHEKCGERTHLTLFRNMYVSIKVREKQRGNQE